MAPNGRGGPVQRCPLFGVDRKSPANGQTDANDPYRPFRRATTATNGRFEDFRQQLSVIIRWPPPNVIDCRRSAQKGSLIRLSSCSGGYHGVACLFGSRAFICGAE